MLTIDINLQTFHRRIQMGEDLNPENPEAWQAYINVVDTIGAAGMSSDETETEATRDTLKVVCRHEKNWRSPDLSRFSRVWIRDTSPGREATNRIDDFPRKVTESPQSPKLSQACH